MAFQTPHCVSISYAKAHFSSILDKVEAGNEFAITRHGTPVARLVPIKIKEDKNHQERRAIIARWVQSTERPSLGDTKIRDLINEGR